MKRTARYFKDPYMKESFTVEYDDESPCKSCGEPVVESSMGGTAICPWCDMGKCRYCGVRLVAFREEIDGGQSLRELREHMKWHRDREPNRNTELLEASRHFDERRKKEAPS